MVRNLKQRMLKDQKNKFKSDQDHGNYNEEILHAKIGRRTEVVKRTTDVSRFVVSQFKKKPQIEEEEEEIPSSDTSSFYSQDPQEIKEFSEENDEVEMEL